MDRGKGAHGEAARSGSRVEGPRRRSNAKWLSIVALALGALWNAWNVVVLVEHGDTPKIPFVAAVLMTAVAVVAWRRWPG